jgi:hypothetical protein
MLNGREAEHIGGHSMRYFVELVFGIGFFGLSAIALTFFMRFLLLTWAVRLAGRIIQNILGFTRQLCHAIIFIFGPALLGGFTLGFSLQFGINFTTNDANSSTYSAQSILLSFIAFLLIVTFRLWQWSIRKNNYTN